MVDNLVDLFLRIRRCFYFPKLVESQTGEIGGCLVQVPYNYAAHPSRPRTDINGDTRVSIMGYHGEWREEWDQTKTRR